MVRRTGFMDDALETASIAEEWGLDRIGRDSA
jgi:hypothetical protein